MITKERIFQEILMARQRVYAVGDVTPLNRLPLLGVTADVWMKREDFGPVKVYKWRGAYNAMACLSPEDRAKGIVTASAGNHAQGVALAAKALSCKAIIFMPRSTPEVKQREVMRHGEGCVEIRLIGDAYDDAEFAATKYCKEVGAFFIHPYNDATTMGGQGTLADEVVMSGKGPFERVYIAVGGGGLIASVAVWLKTYWPEVKVIAVEGVDQASMKAAVEAGHPIKLDYLDVFCDGTAVRKVGDNTFDLCKELVDEYLTVTNDEVCQAIRILWESNRSIPEPSGAMGLAAILQDQNRGILKDGQKILTVICGANMDFSQLVNIAKRAGIGSRHQRFIRVPILEGRGTFLEFLKEIPTGVSIIDVQYGRNDRNIQYPVLGLIGTEVEFAEMDRILLERGVAAVDISKEDISYRIINYTPEIFDNPLFVTIEFPERAGALVEFMSSVKDSASLCYFNYAYSGERVGRSLVGMEFEATESRDRCLQHIQAMVGKSIRAVRKVNDETFYRLTGTKA
jgi:threonine dehydratase